MAQTTESDCARSSDRQASDLTSWPTDVPIVSIEDARCRLNLADSICGDLQQLDEHFQRLRSKVLDCASENDVEVVYDPELMRSVVQLLPDSRWDWCNSLRRVGAYMGIPSPEVRQVIDAVRVATNAAMNAALNGQTAGLLMRSQEVIEQLGAARDAYQHLRDSIAGRLDRLEVDRGAKGSGQPKRSEREGRPRSGTAGEFPSG